MKKYILFLIAFHLLLSFNLASAEIKTFVKEYTYQASELDSKDSCRAIATEQLKRALLEELGTYVESKTLIKDSQLDKDEITTLTAGVIQVIVMDEKWDGKIYWIKAQVKADPDEVAASIDKLKNDEHLAHDLEEARAEAAQAMEEAEFLRQQLAQATADKQKQEQYNEAISQLVASDYFEKGSAFTVAGNYEAAGRAYDHAIIFQPEYSKAYINRSIVYVQLGRYSMAADDLKMAAVLNPEREDAYYTRVELKKRVKDLKVGVTKQNKASMQGARVADPLQKLLDGKKEKKKASLHGTPEKSISIHTEPSGNTATSQPGRVSTGRYIHTPEARGRETKPARLPGVIFGPRGDTNTFRNRGRQSLGTINQRQAPPTVGISRQPSMPAHGISSGSLQVRPDRGSIQPPKTPSVTFGGYRAGSEARSQSLRGQSSRQSSMETRPSSAPASRGSAPAGKSSSKGRPGR